MCLFNFELSENADQQIRHENGFSPICMRMCFFKVELRENANPHASQ